MFQTKVVGHKRGQMMKIPR